MNYMRSESIRLATLKRNTPLYSSNLQLLQLSGRNQILLLLTTTSCTVQGEQTDGMARWETAYITKYSVLITAIT